MIRWTWDVILKDAQIHGQIFNNSWKFYGPVPVSLPVQTNKILCIRVI